MKYLILIAFYLTNFTAHAHDGVDHTVPKDKPSVHGMVLFGEDKIYLSHLPMFHSPHDYQVILSVTLPAAVKESYLKDMQKNPLQLFTIEPEKFSLPDLLSSKKSFLATLYKGRFERGGSVAFQDVTIEVDQVLEFTKLNAKDVAEEEYFFLGDHKAAYLLHKIKGGPNFDQIAKVGVENGALCSFLPATIVGHSEKTPVVMNEVYSLENQDSTCQVKHLGDLYLEFGDLEI